jgi:tetratricopeptide (TPR) repeat protein
MKPVFTKFAARMPVVGALALSLALSACGGKVERINSHLQKGNGYLQQADLEKAGIEVRNVLQMDPKSADAYLLAAQIEESRQEFRKAYGYYSKTIELKPDALGAKVGLARLYLLAGDVEHAQKSVDEILAADARNVEGRVLGAALLAKKGDADAAMRQAEQIVSEGGDVSSEASLLLAGMYNNRGELDKAFKVLELAIAKDGKNIKLLGIAAELAASMKLDTKAMAYFKAATEMAPKNSEMWQVWARYLVQKNDLDKAEQVLRDSIASDKENTARYLSLVDFLAAKRSPDVAEKELRTNIESRPKDYQLRFSLANYYRSTGKAEDFQRVLRDVVDLDKTGPAGLNASNQIAAYKLSMGKTEEAQRMFDEILKASPRDAVALVQRGRMLLSAGNYKDAIIDLRAAEKDQPDSAQVVGLLAQAHLLNKEPQLARDVVLGAAKQDPANTELRLVAVNFLAGNKEVEAALKEADDIIKTTPKNPRVYETKAAIQANAKDWAGAEKTLQALKTQYPDDAIGYLRLGQLYAGEKKIDAALKEYDGAAKKAPKAPEPMIALVGLLAGEHKYDDAAARVDAALKVDPDNATLLQLRGDMAMARKDATGAEAAYRSAIKLAPKDTGAYQRLARALVARNDLPGALAALDEGTKANLQDASLLVSRAELLGRVGKYDEAIATYEELLKRAPDNDLAVNNLAYLLTEVKGDKASLARALQITQKFSDSSNAGYLDTAGWVQYKLGQFDKAVPLLAKAAEKAPDTALIRYHHGMALFKKGDVAAAKLELKSVLVAKLNVPNLDEVKSIVQ